MIVALDHIKLNVLDLTAATVATERLLARSPSGAAFQLDNMAFHLSSGETEGLAGLAFDVVDIEAAFRACERRALAPQKREARTIDLALDAAFGTPITLVERASKFARAQSVTEGAVTGLDHVVIRTTHPNRAAALYGARLGLDMRLDRTEPKWGARLMFFRCGDLIVEIVHDLKNEPSDAPDVLWGLSWRVANAEAANARLKASGFDVSEIRAGRKPGTRVFTVRNNTLNVPTLIVEPKPA